MVVQRCSSLSDKKKRERAQFNPANKNLRCINILVTWMALALMKSDRERSWFLRAKAVAHPEVGPLQNTCSHSGDAISRPRIWGGK